MYSEVNYTLKLSYVSVCCVTKTEPYLLNKAEKYFLKMKVIQTYI